MNIRALPVKKSDIINILIWIVGTEIAGAVSALLAGNMTKIYNGLEKPPLSPPGWAFGAVWAILYALLGIGAWLVFSDSSSDIFLRRRALKLYGLFLASNLLWNPVFFRFRLYGWSSFIIIVIFGLTFFMLLDFWQINRTAAKINLGLPVWLLYAFYLNAGVLLLN